MKKIMLGGLWCMWVCSSYAVRIAHTTHNQDCELNKIMRILKLKFPKAYMRGKPDHSAFRNYVRSGIIEQAKNEKAETSTSPWTILSAPSNHDAARITSSLIKVAMRFYDQQNPLPVPPVQTISHEARSIMDRLNSLDIYIPHELKQNTHTYEVFKSYLQSGLQTWLEQEEKFQKLSEKYRAEGAWFARPAVLSLPWDILGNVTDYNLEDIKESMTMAVASFSAREKH